MNNAYFWKATAIRCARSFLSVILGAWTGDKLFTDIDWRATLIVAFSTTFYIFLACLYAGLPEVKLNQTLYDLDNVPDEEEDDDIEEVGDGTEDDEEGEE